jgi:UDP-2,4-diacetamido-2,4,6-trideoxy-beta-L-altropyranose hydrolase
MGGADINKLSLKYIQLMTHLFPKEKISVLTGTAYRNLDELKELAGKNLSINLYHNLGEEDLCALYSKHQFALVPSSVSCFEAIACGCHILSGYFAENQRRFNTFLAEHKIIMNFGDMNSDSFPEDLEEFFKNPLLFVDLLHVENFRKEITRAEDNFLKLFGALVNADSND